MSKDYSADSFKIQDLRKELELVDIVFKEAIMSLKFKVHPVALYTTLYKNLIILHQALREGNIPEDMVEIARSVARSSADTQLKPVSLKTKMDYEP